jgi:hypothetical protein
MVSKIETFQRSLEERDKLQSQAQDRFEKILKENHLLFANLTSIANFDNPGWDFPRYDVFWSSSSYRPSEIEIIRFYLWPQKDLSKSSLCKHGYIKGLQVKELIRNIPEASVSRSILAVWSCEDNKFFFKPLIYIKSYMKKVLYDKKGKEKVSRKGVIRLVPATKEEAKEISKKYNFTFSPIEKNEHYADTKYYLHLGVLTIQHKKHTLIEENELFPVLANYANYSDDWRIRFKAGINILNKIGDLWT